MRSVRRRWHDTVAVRGPWPDGFADPRRVHRRRRQCPSLARAPHPVDAANDLQIAIQYFLPGTSPRRVKLMLLGKGGTPTPAPPSSDGYDVGVGDRFTWGGATFEVRDICGTDVTLQLTKPSAAPS
ncbi:MAG: hypothetical protein V9F04_15850 [Dermatophilaceae bacterium]